jgi:hypothetical protein
MEKCEAIVKGATQTNERKHVYCDLPATHTSGEEKSLFCHGHFEALRGLEFVKDNRAAARWWAKQGRA